MDATNYDHIPSTNQFRGRRRHVRRLAMREHTRANNRRQRTTPTPFHARPVPSMMLRTPGARLHYFQPAYLLMRSARARKRASHRARVLTTWAISVITVVLVLAAVTGSVAAAVAYYGSEAQALATLPGHIAAQSSVRIYDSHGVLLYQFNNDGAQHTIALGKVPVIVVNATVATEDHDFWVNQGVDFQAIARAAYTDVTAGHVEEGASTVTQQLIKQNVLNSDPTITRKIKEVVLSLGLTTQGAFTKSQILEMYLNSIAYGPTTYGIDAAATTYFGYTDNPATGESAAQHLDLAQASILAGIPQSPVTNNPLAGPTGFANARNRQHTVLGSMVRNGYITQAQADAAWQEAGQPHFFHPQPSPPNLAPHFDAYIQQQLNQMISSGQLHAGPDGLARSGLNVYTTLDLDLQNHVQQAMLDHLCGNDINDYPVSVIYGQRYIREDNVTNAAAVIADQHTGALRVLLGSLDFTGTKTCHKGVPLQFDVATQGFRQSGSSFKPIVYATAFQKGWTPNTIVHNEPTRFWDPGAGKWYAPHDADNHHLAQNMTVRDALQLSQNIPAVETMQFAGVDNVKRNAQLWGIHDWRGTWGLSSVLGSLDVHPIDMVQVYTVFANYGEYIPLHAIDHITNTAGDVVFQYQQPKPVQVLDPKIAYLITNILSDNPARIPEFNVCSPLYLDPSKADCLAHHGNSPNVWPAAAKTGTADDLTNDWTLGYTMDYTMGVWVGNNNFTAMNWVDGVTGAAPIFYNSMLYAERNLPKTPFPVPDGVSQLLQPPPKAAPNPKAKHKPKTKSAAKPQSSVIAN